LRLGKSRGVREAIALETFALKDVESLQDIKGVPFPEGVSFRQLIVTGPPGVGKTTLIDVLGGWPEEGFLDLTKANWWRSRVLAFRPRQLHLGLPFEGHRHGVSVFDVEWADGDAPPVLDLSRIELPPLGGARDPWRWRKPYVFEFLLPPAQKVFDARVRRSDRHSHVVDSEITLDRVEAQLDASWRVARHLHNAGLLVYVRDDFGAKPKVFAEPNSADIVEAQLRGDPRVRGRSFFQTYIDRLLSPSGFRVLDRFERVELRGRRALVPRRVLPVAVGLGSERLEIHPDEDREVRILDPARYFAGSAGFARVAVGGSYRLPDGGPVSPVHLQGTAARIEIGNEGDWLRVMDLESPSGTSLQSLHGADARRLEHDRAERLQRLRSLLHDMPPALAPGPASVELERAIEMLEAGRWRPRDGRGEPGGLVELPDDTTPIIVGDLHGRVDNLLTILSEGRHLDALEERRAALILLGDVVHPEDGDLADMGGSLLITDVLIRLMLAFPGQIVHLRGNHETFSSEITKSGVAQGQKWKEWLRRERGAEAVTRMRRFYDLLPHVAVGDGFIACHAGPPTGTVTRKKLVNVHKDKRLSHQITWGRVRSPRRPGGYGKRDVRSLQKALDQPKPSVVIVSHNPGPGRDSVVLEHGGIKRHHLVYSARADQVALFTRFDAGLVPLVYPVHHDFSGVVPSSEAAR
jgi:hypothetical protein